MDKKSRDLVMGRLYLKNKDYKMAEKSFSDYLSFNPDDFQAMKMLAQVQEHLNDTAKAFDLYQRCYLSQPDRKGVLLDICRLLLMNDSNLDHVDTKKWLKLAVQAFPTNPIVKNLRESLPNSQDSHPGRVTSEDLIVEKLTLLEDRFKNIEDHIKNVEEKLNELFVNFSVSKSSSGVVVNSSPEKPNQTGLFFGSKLSSESPQRNQSTENELKTTSFVKDNPTNSQATFNFGGGNLFSGNLKKFNLPTEGSWASPLPTKEEKKDESKVDKERDYENKVVSSKELPFKNICDKKSLEVKSGDKNEDSTTPKPSNNTAVKTNTESSSTITSPKKEDKPTDTGSFFGSKLSTENPLQFNLPTDNTWKSTLLNTDNSANPSSAFNFGGNLFAESLKKFNMPTEGSWISSPPTEVKKEENNQDEENDEESEVVNTVELPIENTCDMKPIEIISGEENEDIVFQHRCKLFRFRDKEYKERGLGNIKVLRHKETGKGRLIMRRDLINLVCLNCWECTKIERVRDTQVRFAGQDASDGDPEITVFLAKFKTPESTDNFLRHLQELFPEAEN